MDNNAPPRLLEPIQYYYGLFPIITGTLGIIIQITALPDGRFVIMDMFSSNWKFGSTPDDIVSLINEIYKIDITTGSLHTTPDLTNEDLQYVRENINPKVLLPFRIPFESNGTIKFMRYFTRDLIENNLNPDEIGPETLILTYKPSTNNIGPAGWTYYDPTTTNRLYGLNIPGKYTEITKEEFNSNQKRLVVYTFPEITTEEQFDHITTQYLSGVFISDKKYYLTDDIIDTINDNFAKHTDFSFLQNKANTIPVPPPSGKNKNTAVTSLLDTIPESLSEEFNLVNFLRSYVDLYHDILEYGKDYAKIYLSKYIEELSKKGAVGIDIKDKLDKEINEINKRIFTKTGKINQTQCKSYVEDLTSRFIEKLHIAGIKTIPKTKENAFVMSASLDNPTELNELFNTLKTDDVTRFFVESANNDIGIKLYFKNFKICNLNIGDWDAGSGFSGKTIRPQPTIYNIGPTQGLPNYHINMFNSFLVQVSDDNNAIKVSYSSDGGGVQSIIISPRTKLSVNKILNTTDNVTVRGTEDVESGILVTAPQITPASPLIDKAGIISLKTWTDLIQIVSLSKTMSLARIPPNNSGNKILTVIYDGLCETTARLYGLGHVLKTEGKIITYYSYNIHSRRLGTERYNQKARVKSYITYNKPFFLKYFRLWFEQRIQTLKNINEISYNPVLYFVSELFISKYEQAAKKAEESINNIDRQEIISIPDTIQEYIESQSSSSVLLGDLQDSIAKFNLAISKIIEIGKRPSMDTFLNAYDYVQQQIVNSFNESDTIELRSMIASLFAFVYLQYPRDGASAAFTAFEAIKRKIAETFQLSPNIRASLNILKKANTFDATYFKNIYLPRVKGLPEEIQSRLKNIIDIEIAIRRLKRLSITYNGAKITYQNYIKDIHQGPYYPILSAFSFLSVYSTVEEKIRELIHDEKYKGGYSNYRRKTYKHKQNKRKTHKKK